MLDQGDQQLSKNPMAFISWAHGSTNDTPDRRQQWLNSVARFAALLRANGIRAEVDLYYVTDSTVDWTRFGPKMVSQADYVLIALTPAYAERWLGKNDPAEGAGAVQEADSLKGLFARDQAEFQRKVKIVLLPGVSDDAVPDDLARLQRFPLNSLAQTELEPLLRMLTGQPEFEKPALGEVPLLPSTRVPTAESASDVEGSSPEDDTTKVRSAANLDELRAELERVQQLLGKVPSEDVGDGPHIPWFRERERLRQREHAISSAISAMTGASDMSSEQRGAGISGDVPWTAEVERLDPGIRVYLGYVHHEPSGRIDYFSWGVEAQAWVNTLTHEIAPEDQGQLLSILVAHANARDLPRLRAQWRNDEPFFLDD